MSRYHTAGPWVVSRQKNLQREIRIQADGPGGFGQEVADIYTHHENSGKNAHLISAAPEMYLALKELLYCYEHDRKPTKLLMDITKKALDKAEGDFV